MSFNIIMKFSTSLHLSIDDTKLFFFFIKLGSLWCLSSHMKQGFSLVSKLLQWLGTGDCKHSHTINKVNRCYSQHNFSAFCHAMILEVHARDIDISFELLWKWSVNERLNSGCRSFPLISLTWSSTALAAYWRKANSNKSDSLWVNPAKGI